MRNMEDRNLDPCAGKSTKVELGRNEDRIALVEMTYPMLGRIERLERSKGDTTLAERAPSVLVRDAVDDLDRIAALPLGPHASEKVPVLIRERVGCRSRVDAVDTNIVATCLMERENIRRGGFAVARLIEEAAVFDRRLRLI